MPSPRRARAAAVATAALSTLTVLTMAAAVGTVERRDCADFTSWRQAQDTLESLPVDLHGLDLDGDGIACASLRARPAPIAATTAAVSAATAATGPVRARPPSAPDPTPATPPAYPPDPAGTAGPHIVGVAASEPR